MLDWVYLVDGRKSIEAGRDHDLYSGLSHWSFDHIPH